MRIVIDMQGAQTESRFRGIGRYTQAFAQAVVRNRGEHEIILVLSGLFPDTIAPIRTAFHGLLPRENIRVWHAPGPLREDHPGNDSRHQMAEVIREAFLASLLPDVIHVSSLFDGCGNDAVASIGSFDKKTPVTAILYDLIPLLNADAYLEPHPRFKNYYLRKVGYLKQAAVLFAISEFARQEGLAHLGLPEDRIVNISTAIEPHFQPLSGSFDEAELLYRRIGIDRSFVLYTGGGDERKNLPRLIDAFAGLPSQIRQAHQLLLAGKMPDDIVAGLKERALGVGLAPDQLCFSGYVSDEELVGLYNSCQLYVFPSWHEGFGLPALEAMACGAPVIGAYTSSLPEVIGLEEALFDPLDVSSITAKMAQALTDDALRNRLRIHGLEHAKRFSWDETALRAIAAWESLPELPKRPSVDSTTRHAGLYARLARHSGLHDGSDLPATAACLALNEQAGLERQLLLDVSELCQHDSATGVQRVVRSYLRSLLERPPPGFRVEPVYATLQQGYRYARRFTHRFLGLSDAAIVDEPLRWQRGDVFFGLDMQHHVQLAHQDFYRELQAAGVVVKFLVHDLLPIQLPNCFRDPNASQLHAQWLSMIAATDGAICVSKATSEAYTDWIEKTGIRKARHFGCSWVHNAADIDGSVASQGLPSDALDTLQVIRGRPTFLCVATLEPRKAQGQILDAVELLWRDGEDVNLVFVGQQGWQTDDLAERIRAHPEHGQRLHWLQAISDEYLEQVYAASTCLVAASLNEGFGLPLIEAARHGLPLVARDIPVFREIAGDAAFYFSGETADQLAVALRGWSDQYQRNQHPKPDGIRWSTWQESAENLKTELIGRNYPRRQLLVDISELVRHDARTGIQRVVRAILMAWLNRPPENYRVEPVYATLDQGYRYARRFVAEFTGDVDAARQDEVIDYAPGDIFFGLDLKPDVQIVRMDFYQHLRSCGVEVLFLVYDLLCIQMPHNFASHVSQGFTQWLNMVAACDGAICISKTTAHNVTEWMGAHHAERLQSFRIDWFHIGADVENSSPSTGLPDDSEKVLDRLQLRPTFLMVGTLEPRKGHTTALDGFETLWRSGVDVNLVIVGKQGWMVDSLVQRIQHHPEHSRRLFWLDGISDEYLERLYSDSTCLIAAAFGEGFGLPLIEAAQHGLPIIARDIPVFREVAQDHAWYFNADDPENFAAQIRQWLLNYADATHPGSQDMPWLTWEQSAAMLARKIIHSNSSPNRCLSETPAPAMAIAAEEHDGDRRDV